MALPNTRMNPAAITFCGIIQTTWRRRLCAIRSAYWTVMLRLGFFREFKFEGEDMVLLTGTNEDIRVLNDRIGAALSNSIDVVALHDLASVAQITSLKYSRF